MRTSCLQTQQIPYKEILKGNRNWGGEKVSCCLFNLYGSVTNYSPHQRNGDSGLGQAPFSKSLLKYSNGAQLGSLLSLKQKVCMLLAKALRVDGASAYVYIQYFPNIQRKNANVKYAAKLYSEKSTPELHGICI